MPMDPRDWRRRSAKKQDLGIGEAARALGVPITTLRYWIDTGKVPGVQVTRGGHRWMSRDCLLRFARAKGLSRIASDRRGAPRVRAHKIRIRVECRPKGRQETIGEGSGRLWDLSSTGFRLDRLKWRGDFIPRLDTLFGFGTDMGRLDGVQGKAKVAWILDNRRKRGITLGARVERFDGPEAKRIWERYIRKRARKQEG